MTKAAPFNPMNASEPPANLELTDDPARVVLTPNLLCAALGLLNWTPHSLARRTEIWPWSLSKDLADFLSFGGGLTDCQMRRIKRVLCRRLWFCTHSHGPGLVLKPRAKDALKGAMVSHNKRNHLAVAP